MIERDVEIARLLLEHARDIFLVIRAEDGRILDVNRAAEVAYGYSRDELRAMDVNDIRPAPDPTVAEKLRRADEQGIQFEALHRRRDGTPFPVEVSSRGITVGAERYLFSIVRDISERKAFEREREALLAATQQALRQREDFLVVASHELRTPLSNVGLQLQHLLRMLEREGTSRERLLACAQAGLREARRLGSLIDGIVAAQHPHRPLELRRGDVDLAGLVHEVVDRLRLRAEQAGCELRVEATHVIGSWDRARLDQALTNLVVNALKFGRGRPVTVRASAGVDRARVEVADRGIGIASEDAQRIFARFERASPTDHGGLGLGLFIARHVIEAHGGTLEVESTPGAGATFRVTVPLAQSPHPAADHRRRR